MSGVWATLGFVFLAWWLFEVLRYISFAAHFVRNFIWGFVDAFKHKRRAAR